MLASLALRDKKTSRDNRTLIRSGKAPAIGWSRNMLYSGFNNLLRSVFWSANFNGRSDNLDVELKTNCFSCFLSSCELHFGVLFLLRLGSTSGYNDF